MSRESAIAAAERFFDEGGFAERLGRRVAIPTESQNPARGAALRQYLEQEIAPEMERLGASWRILDNPREGFGPFLIGERREGDDLPTVLTYGHGDVILGYDEAWSEGLGPWKTTLRGERLYGRGTADNKGQHTIDLAALEAVLEARGRLGFNVRILVEMGEETGSPGLHAIARQEREALAADVLIASDGPRLQADRPTVFCGSRGAVNFDLVCDLREGGHHSGNWGGLLANPGTILASAIASIVDGRGRILVEGLRPDPIPESVRRVLDGLPIGGGDGPEIDPEWGEPGLTPVERVFAWNTFEILAFTCGNPEKPANAIPPKAMARCQMRFVAGCDLESFLPAIRAHLDAHGFQRVEVTGPRETPFRATRVDPEDPWVRWAVDSLERTTGKPPALLPNLGGSLPNDVFAEILGMPTVWVPHSYAACQQHAPDEHLLLPIAREGLAIMAGLWWDLGENPPG